MEYIHSSDFSLKSTCVTLGKFDGLHVGHQKLMQELAKGKKEGGRKSVVFTFDFHPSMFLAKEAYKLIYTEKEKQQMLAAAGIDVFISYPFTRETSSMEAEDFIRQVLVKQLDAKLIVVGEDNRFGHNRRGDAQMLLRFGREYGFHVTVCEKVRFDNDVVSSTKIREELLRGNMERAGAMLGEPYYVSGVVEHGRALGRTIGFPTINLVTSEEKLLPPYGVYVSQTILRKKTYTGMTNVGVRPTVGQQKKAWVETYLFDYSGDCYGEQAITKLLHFVRPEKQFKSVDELREQLACDTLVCQSVIFNTKKI